jgi:uncharacterized iron-regulated membrane protein
MSPSDAVWIAPAVVAASVAGAVALLSESLRAVSARRDRRASQAREDVLAALTALRAVRSAYRRNGDDSASVHDLEDALWLAVAVTLDAGAMAAAKRYVLAGDRSAHPDEELAVEDDEGAAYLALSAELCHYLGRHR